MIEYKRICMIVSQIWYSACLLKTCVFSCDWYTSKSKLIFSVLQCSEILDSLNLLQLAEQRHWTKQKAKFLLFIFQNKSERRVFWDYMLSSIQTYVQNRTRKTSQCVIWPSEKFGYVAVLFLKIWCLYPREPWEVWRKRRQCEKYWNCNCSWVM